MSLFTLLLVAVALGTDAFALAIGIGMTGISRGMILTVSAVVCLFHIFSPLIGLGVGMVFGKLVGNVATFIGAVVLVVIGLNMLWKVIKERNGHRSFQEARQEMNQKKKEAKALESFWGLMLLAGSVSIDALSVGFGLGALKAQIVGTVLTIGLVAGSMTAAGFYLGRGLGRWLGEKAEIVGGIILTAVGIRLFF